MDAAGHSIHPASPCRYSACANRHAAPAGLASLPPLAGRLSAPPIVPSLARSSLRAARAFFWALGVIGPWMDVFAAVRETLQ